jgi:hypothetical protein
VDGNARQGQAFLFSGATGGSLHALNDPDRQEGALFGWSVAAVGDVDGDSIVDLVVGAPGQNVDGKSDQGQASVFSGAAGTLGCLLPE